MRRMFFAAMLAMCATFGHAQAFPLGASFVFSPKTGRTVAAVEVDDPRGYLPAFPVPFTKLKLDLTPFGYAGVQLGGENNGAAGFGLKLVKVSGPVTYHIGGTYGLVAGDNSPHFGLVFGVLFNLSPRP